MEGCLSIPETYGTVERADEVTVRYFDREGEEMEVTAYGYLARAFQHEIDHLNGELFIDKMIEKIAPEDLEAYMEEHFDDENCIYGHTSLFCSDFRKFNRGRL